MNKMLTWAAAVATTAFAFTFSTTALAGGDATIGKQLVGKYNCARCHGADFNSPTEAAYPKLAGQHEDYIKHALTAYRRGGNAANGRNNALMAPEVKPLSDSDINNIAAYLHSLPGTLVVRK
ncbi:cytochrome c [Herbaspirillum lusitanum]|jgi:cytochrome c553|uniref:Cytochrome c n=1 Tax=Herbaspirillum lusitanum TaxID=213312 RepID=A0ABW9A1U1_9BURK